MHPKLKHLLNLNRTPRNLLDGASISLAIKSLGTAFSFLFNISIAQLIGADGAGQFFLVLSVGTIATVFADLGLSQAALRFVAVGSSQQNWSAVKGMYQQSLSLTLVASGIVSGLTYIAAPWIAEGLFAKPDLTVPLQWMTLSILPIALLWLHTNLLQGLQQILAFSCLQVPGLGFSMLAILGLYGFSGVPGVLRAIFAYVAAAIGMMLVSLYLWSTAALQIKGILGKFQRQTLLQTSIPILWVKIANIVVSKTSTTLMLGVFLTNHEVGVYGMAFRTAALTTFFLGTVSNVAAPKFAALYGANALTELKTVAHHSAKLTLIVGGPLLIPLMVCPGLILRWFGSDFSEGALALMILAAGQLINAATGAVEPLLIMSGHEKYVRNNTLASALCNLLLNLLLIPLWGINGAAVADSLTIAVQNLTASFWAQQKLGFSPIAFWQGR
jgi:O-antigen/teichoic acid export membrane protein